ncbi:MAG: hypothetical protein EP319_07245 [Deltaproteobacteria bacterium]|nr:MAG: hypothetical protein EP319_07245 [Deltaproteobacteria bacterium]
MSDDTNNDQGFNEEELQDIMNEIEDLEKEYVEETAEASANPHDDLQDTIDKEIEELNKIEITEPTSEDDDEDIVAEMEEVEAEMAEVEAEMEEIEEDNVVSIVKEAPTSSSSSSSSEGTYSGAPVEFTAHGDMNLNMNFTVGESTATLMVSKERGLCVQMDGVNLEIGEDGCTVELAGGVRFTVPLTAGGTASKKKAA